MEEIKIIRKLEALKAIKPSADWAVSTKKMIVARQFEREVPRATFASFNPSAIFSKALTPTFAALAVMVIAGSTVVYTASERSLPGEKLFALKQATENIQVSMLSSKDQSAARIAQAEDRLNELDNITKQSENQGSKLAAGISEAQKALSVAAKELNKMPDNQKAEVASQIVKKISQIEKTTNASIIDSSSSDYAELYKTFAENQIKDFEDNESNLTAEQKILLKHAKESFDVEDYAQATEYLYQIQPESAE